MIDIDRDWFKDELKHQGKTSNELSKYLNIDPSAITRIWNNDRRMLPEEAIKIAEFLGHPLDVILHKAGLPVSEITPNKYVKTEGTIDKNGNVKPHRRKRDATPVPLPPGVTLAAKALMYDTTNTPLDYMDRWILYYAPESDFSPDALNQLCIVNTKDETTKLAVVKKGDRRGLYRLFNMIGKEEKEQKQIVTASPVLWIKS